MRSTEGIGAAREVSSELAGREGRVFDDHGPLVVIAVCSGLFYIALSRTLATRFDPLLWRFHASLVVAGLVAALGLFELFMRRAHPLTGVLKRYMAWGTALSAAISLSTVASWNAIAFYHGRMLILWILVLIVGLSVLLRDVRYRRALVAGFVIGVSVLLCVAFWRVVRGLSAFDLVAPGGRASVLGVNRNPINVMVLVLSPFLVLHQLPRLLRLIRLPLLTMIVVWLATNGGRSGLVGLVFVAITFGLLQRDMSRRLRVLLMVAALGSVAVLGLQEFARSSGESAERLSRTFSGESLPGDESRRLLLRKAWHLAADHPVMGIGFGTFPGSYHPIVEQASNTRVRTAAIASTSHNTYAAVLAEGGFIALALFIAFVTSLVRSGYRHRRSAAVTAALTGVAGLLFLMLVEFILDPLFYLPVALLLGASSAHEFGGSAPTATQQEEAQAGDSDSPP